MKFCQDCKDELLNAVVDQPHAGQHLMAIKMRLPYQSAPEVVLIDLDSISSSTAAALLSEHSSQKTATTSVDDGSVSRLSAIALAVRNRSYNAIAAFCSYIGAARCNIFNRASNLSVPLVNDMGAPLVDGKVESPHRTAKRSTRPVAGLAAALAALTLTACADGVCDVDAVVTPTAGVAAVTTASSPAPVAEATLPPTPATTTPAAPAAPAPILVCPQSSTTAAGCPDSPTPLPVRHIVVDPNQPPACVRDNTIALVYADLFWVDNCGNKYGTNS